jgi:hypothetical protein
MGLAELGRFHAPPFVLLLAVLYSVCTLEAPGVCGRADPGLLLFLECMSFEKKKCVCLCCACVNLL